MLFIKVSTLFRKLVVLGSIASDGKIPEPRNGVILLVVTVSTT